MRNLYIICYFGLCLMVLLLSLLLQSTLIDLLAVIVLLDLQICILRLLVHVAFHLILLCWVVNVWVQVYGYYFVELCLPVFELVCLLLSHIVRVITDCDVTIKKSISPDYFHWL